MVGKNVVLAYWSYVGEYSLGGWVHWWVGWLVKTQAAHARHEGYLWYNIAFSENICKHGRFVWNSFAEVRSKKCYTLYSWSVLTSCVVISLIRPTQGMFFFNPLFLP